MVALLQCISRPLGCGFERKGRGDCEERGLKWSGLLKQHLFPFLFQFLARTQLAGIVTVIMQSKSIRMNPTPQQAA
jgi:hypothetical protein